MDLHELHLRRLQATVQLIEASLERMERLLAESNRGAIMSAVDSTLPANQRAHLLEGVRELRNNLARFAGEFRLEPHHSDVRQLLNAELSSAWVMLENCRPKRMKGYGVEFSPDARKALEQAVEDLLEQVRGMRKLLR